MSHFTVLVIGEDVERQLAPFHEFECTGNDDEFVREIDRTEEARAEYESGKETRLRAPDGSLHEPYADCFYRDPTPEEMEKIGKPLGSGNAAGISFSSRDWGDGLGYRAKVRYVPDGWETVEVPRPLVESFAEWVEDWYGWDVVPIGQEPDREGAHKYGWCRVDAVGDPVECIDRTNPNKKWDWWVIGGRWSGLFKLRPHAYAGRLGEPGTFEALMPREEREALAVERLTERRVDQARKGDIDFDAMRDEAGAKAADRYDRARKLIGNHPIHTWEEVRAEHPGDIDAARKAYWSQPATRALHDSADEELQWMTADEFRVSREEYIERGRSGAVRTFAVVRDGQWHERGEMGWFGCVANEKDEDAWDREFAALLDGLPDDTLLTVVDCHI